MPASCQQDYNSEVLTRLTAPNVAANKPDGARFHGSIKQQANKQTDIALEQHEAQQGSHPYADGASTAQIHQSAPGQQLDGDTAAAHTRQTSTCMPASRFFAGDWGGLPEFLQQEGLLGSYDLVLTAETIYSPASLQPLLDCIVAVRSSSAGFCCTASERRFALAAVSETMISAMLMRMVGGVACR